MYRVRCTVVLRERIMVQVVAHCLDKSCYGLLGGFFTKSKFLHIRKGKRMRSKLGEMCRVIV